MIKAYFFDWIGTLGNVKNSFNIIRPFLTKKQHVSLLTRNFEDADIPEEHRQEIYDLLMNENHYLYEDTEKLIYELKQDYKLAIVSNMYGISGERIRGLFPDFLSQFDFVTFSAEAGLKKPDPKIFYHTLDRLNGQYKAMESNEVMMIGDKLDKDVEPPLRLGMQARLIDRSKQNLGDVIFN